MVSLQYNLCKVRNDSRYVVEQLGVNIIVVATLDARRTLISPLIDCEFLECRLPITMRRRQFPLPCGVRGDIQ